MDVNNLFTGERFIPGIEDAQLEVEHYQRYLSVRSLIRDKVVLDAACGEGYGSSIMAKVAREVHGIDLDEDTITRAKKTYASQSNLHYMQGNIEKLELADHSIDVVVSFETIEHVSEETQGKFLEEIGRVLKEDGFLVMSTPNKKIYSDLHHYKNEFHIKEFYRDEFLAFLGSRFSHIKLFNQSFEVVSVLTAHGGQEGEIALYDNKKVQDQDGKYYIAVASNTEVDVRAFSSVYLERFGEYEEKVERILSLQNEVEERNNHIKTLDAETDRLGGIIRGLQDEEKEKTLQIKILEDLISQYKIRIEGYAESFSRQANVLALQQEQLTHQAEMIDTLSKHNGELESNLEGLMQQVRNKEGHIEQLLEVERAYEHEIDTLSKHNGELESNLESLMQTVRNKEGHIEQLLEVERAYEHEKQTHSYKFGKALQKTGDFLLPLNSRRRFFCRVIINLLKHPRLMLHVINPKRVRNYFRYMKLEGMEGVSARYKEAVEVEKSYLNPADRLDVELDKVRSSKNKADLCVEDFEEIIVPAYQNPLVSIVIPVYNEFNYTYNCIKSIVKNSGDIPYEILVADDCSTDITRELDKIIENVRHITTEQNIRFLLNCNNAAKFANGKYILFLNNDTQVQQDWLSPLVALIESNNKIGMVGCKLVYPDGRLQEAGGILWKDGSAWNYGNKQNPNDPEFNYVHETDYISGAAIMIRAKLWKEIGGFDTRFIPAYCEDSDLAFEVRKHGYQVVFQPKSVVVHFEGISNGTDLNSGQKKYQVENQKKFYEKWKNALKKENFENGTDVFLARDRSRSKKHILVIDHYVPQYDKDAGSKTTYMYLKMMVKKGYQVTFLGDNFYQHEPYTTELQQMGIFVLYGSKYAQNWEKWLLENIKYFDIFYLNRPHISIKYIDLIKEHAKGKIIYYGHDLHFMRIKREYEISKDIKLLKESEKWLEQEFYIMHKADMNYYPSELERAEINRLDPTVPVKAITAYIYEEPRNIKYDIRDRKGLLFVGGFVHDPNVDAVKWFLNAIYPEVYKKLGIPFYIVGSNAPVELTSVHMDGVVMKGYVTEEELRQLYDACRMVVVPLRYGAGVKGKVVEAMYNGVPVVTTSVGAEGIPGIEEAVSVQETEKDMVESICSLYASEEDLKRMSQKGQKLIKQNFSLEAVWNIVKDDFGS